MSAIVGPIAPQNNPPINPQYYNPSRFVISGITLGQTTTVTTSIANDYKIGGEVRLLIPPAYGSIQLNEVTGIILSLPSSTQVVLNIDSSRNVNPFISASTTQQPQILPVGDVNSGQINASGRNSNITYINGSFINISPA